jgi:hypothetical protein
VNDYDKYAGYQPCFYNRRYTQHKIREHNYEVTKDMTMEEILRYYNTPRTDAEERIERIRRQNAAKNKAEFRDSTMVLKILKTIDNTWKYGHFWTKKR